MLDNKGQALGVMGIILLIVAVMVGALVVGEVYDSVDQTSYPASVTSAMDDVLDNGTTGLSLLGIGAIVGAAMFIIVLLGGK